MSTRNISLFLACFMLITFAGVFQAAAQDPEAMKATAQGIYDALSAQDIDQYLSYYTDDVIFDVIPAPPTLNGKEELRTFMAGLVQGFPDISFTPQRMLTSGDTLVCEYIVAGTQAEAWLGMPATGNSAQMMAFDVMDFEGDKVKQTANYWDVQGLMMQLGLMPASELPELVPSFTLPEPEATGLSPVDAVVETQTRWNTHDLASYAQMQHTDHVAMFAAVGVPLDREAEAAMHELYFLSNSELNVESLRTIDMGNGWVLSECVWRGVHDGPYFGIPATGNPIDLKGAILYRFDADGLQTNMNVYFDNVTVLTQMGVFPPLPPMPELPPIPDYLVEDQITSPSLEGNLLGDPATRDMLIYLPPTYDTSPDTRYPVIYLLHGFTGDHRMFAFTLNVTMQSLTGIDLGVDIGDIVNSLMASGDLGEVIIVMPDASNAYGGSWYEQSEVIGDYRTYIAQELVDYIDGKYRTIADREHRAIAGHSMGGYGALSLAIEYSDVFGAVAALSPGNPNDLEVEPTEIDRFIAANPDTLGLPIMVSTDEDMWKLFLISFDTNDFYSMAAAYSCNPDNPPYYVDLPVQYPEKTVVQEVWDKWLDRDLVSQIERDGANLSDTPIFIDQGVGETVLMEEVPAVDRLLAALDAQTIPYTYDEFDGDHLTYISYQLSSALTFLSPHIEATLLPETELNKIIARRGYEEVWNQQSQTVYEEIYSPDLVNHEPTGDLVGIEALKQFVAIYLAAAPDIHFTIDDQVAAGDMVASRWTSLSTSTGEFMGIPPTGEQGTVTGISIDRIVDGKIVEAWSSFDSLGMMQQLGVIISARENYGWGEPDQSEITGEAGDSETNKVVVTRYIEEVWNQGTLDVLDEIFNPDHVGHTPVEPNNPLVGIEAAKEAVTMYHTAFPDFKFTIEAMFAEGDKVVTRWASTGTHGGELMGIPPTGKETTATGIVINRVVDGMITDCWWAWDALGLIQQIMPTQEEINMALVLYDIEEVWNKGNLDVADEVIAADYVHYAGGVPAAEGPEGYKQMVTMYRTALPDLQFTVDEMIAEGDKLVTRYTVTGTHQGELMGVPATGNPVTVTGIAISYIADGKFVQAWGASDILGLMQQIGAVTPGRPTPEDYAWGAPSEVTGDPGDPEANKALIMRFNDEVWNQQNLDVLDEIFIVDQISHNPSVGFMYDPRSGIESLRLALTDYLTAFPDIHIVINDMIAEGDKVGERWTATGTHQGELMGVPATGNSVTFTGHTIYRLADGKVVEMWLCLDIMGLMQQISAPEGIKGDVNNDGRIRSNDAIWTLRISVGLMEATDEQKWAADMNDDGEVRSNDAILILRAAAGLAAPDMGAAGVSRQRITVTLAEVYGTAGESVTVPLKVDSISGLAGGDICIAYDSAVLRAIDISSDAGMLLAGNVKESGMVRIAFADAGSLNSGTLAEIQFSILADAISPLELKDVELYRPDALPIDSRKLDGKFVSWAMPPENSALLQNFPNPFNPETWIPYQLREDSEVTIRIHNQAGELVREFDLGHRSAGLYLNRDRSAYWDGKNEAGEEVASGIYFYSITAGDDFSVTRKMVIRK